jgi:hypothetical protein
MKSLYDSVTVVDIRMRLTRLKARDEPQWGRMNVAQALAHCCGVLELALGHRRPPRVLIGRILGPVLKRVALGSDAPIRRNAPTIDELVVLDRRDLDEERKRLLALIEQFAAGGPAVCTTHPHPFFGRLSPQEWAVFEYKHLDHHLRQFGS